ncbi:hypothetical protein [Actinomadura sp. 9N215]|uniref:hypothetical protein n=1 Tax=Actinomadura sp. 9N215 TaxID=3375150 RepID=UPI00379CA472
MAQMIEVEMFAAVADMTLDGDHGRRETAMIIVAGVMSAPLPHPGAWGPAPSLTAGHFAAHSSRVTGRRK